MIVTTDWLATHLEDVNLRVVDIRGRVLPASAPPPHYFSHRDAYETSHIPGAVFVDWTQDIVEPNSPSNDVASPERYARLMSRLGIGDDTFVVAYDDAQGMFAARLWWTLQYYGHTQAAVLDGGWSKWTAEGRPVTAEKPDVRPAQFTPRPQPHLRRTAREIMEHSENVKLLDVRSPGEFAGEFSRGQRKGHIPGALNIPRKRLVDEDGTILPAEKLQAIFADAGLNPESDEVIVYCNSGVSASFGLLALRAVGVERASVYDGSWKDWSGNPANPIAQSSGDKTAGDG